MKAAWLGCRRSSNRQALEVQGRAGGARSRPSRGTPSALLLGVERGGMCSACPGTLCCAALCCAVAGCAAARGRTHRSPSDRQLRPRRCRRADPGLCRAPAAPAGHALHRLPALSGACVPGRPCPRLSVGAFKIQDGCPVSGRLGACAGSSPFWCPLVPAWQRPGLGRLCENVRCATAGCCHPANPTQPHQIHPSPAPPRRKQASSPLLRGATALRTLFLGGVRALGLPSDAEEALETVAALRVREGRGGGTWLKGPSGV